MDYCKKMDTLSEENFGDDRFFCRNLILRINDFHFFFIILMSQGKINERKKKITQAKIKEWVNRKLIENYITSKHSLPYYTYISGHIFDTGKKSVKFY